MRPLNELINEAESALPFVTETVQSCPGRCVMHPASPKAPEVLHNTQVTTRSPMGAIAYHTGGISVLGGWIRILGSGSDAIPRNLPDWNKDRSAGFYLVADDAFGGFFALNGGALGPDGGQIYYFSPRSLRWEALQCSYTQFLTWACTDFKGFYDDMTWPGCEEVIARLSPDRCFFFYPPLWTKECVLPPTQIRDVPVTEAWRAQVDIARQLDLPKLPEGWFYPEDADIGSRLHAELQRELPPGHLLFGCAVETFAYRHGSDDVLFRHREQPGRFTVIHLSWIQ